MDKVIRGDRVAVLYSPGFGAGWYTWNINYDDNLNPEALLFDPKLVELVESIDSGLNIDIYAEIEKRAEEIVPDGYFGGLYDLRIMWLPVGTKFIVEEYDGSESIRVLENTQWMTA